MTLVGLSGSLGSGKSTVGRVLASLGAEVIDADDVAREVLAPGTTASRAVLERFGPAVTRPDGFLDRQALAAVVFSDAEQRLALEAITHPAVQREVARRVASAKADVVVVELPLLDRARRRQYHFDVVVLVDVPEEVAVARAVARGMPEADVRARIAAQPTAGERRAAADLVLDNAGARSELEARVSELWRRVEDMARESRESRESREAPSPLAPPA